MRRTRSQGVALPVATRDEVENLKIMELERIMDKINNREALTASEMAMVRSGPAKIPSGAIKKYQKYQDKLSANINYHEDILWKHFASEIDTYVNASKAVLNEMRRDIGLSQRVC